MAISKSKQEIKYSWACFGYTRGNGKVWHGGQDIVVHDGLLTMADYDGKEISGVVDCAKIVTNKRNKTWEWGYFVRIKLDPKQTPDKVNYLIYAHCEKLLVKTGERVKSGDPIAIMGNTGNAALANPPYKHCHFEARETCTGVGVSPIHYSGMENKVCVLGITNTKPATENKTIQLKKGNWNIRKGPGINYKIVGVVTGSRVLGYVSFDGQWYKTIYGYISKKAVLKEGV